MTATRRIGHLVVSVTAVGASLALLGIAPAAAQTGFAEEHIGRYAVFIAVERAGTILVTERIAYDFGSTEHHGIVRDIPVVFRYSQKFDRVDKIKVLSVTGSNGTPTKTSTSTNGDTFEIKIGDPKKTISGAHTYTIEYRVTGALNAFSDHDELYWNAVGTQWSVPIEHPAATVTVPATIRRVACFAGPFGSSLPCSHATFHGSTARFTNGSLGPDEGLSVVVGFPKAAVPPPHPLLRERWAFSRAFAATPATVGIAGALLLLLLMGIAWLGWTRGRDVRARGSAVDIAFAGDGATPDREQRVGLLERGAVPVEYAPPEGIKPAEAAVLMHERATALDVTATVVDLAGRGFLRIEEIPKQGLFGKPDWRLVKVEEPDGLQPFERTLLDGIFSNAESDQADPPAMGGDGGGVATRAGLAHVRLSKLRSHFSAELKNVESQLYEDAVANRWFPARPDKVRDRWHGRGFLLLLLGMGATIGLAAKTHLGLIALPIVIAGLVLMRVAGRMPRRTAKGTGMVRRVYGFRRYIDTAEVQEAKFDEQVNLFTKYLPYAIVFGAVEKWARAFRGLADQEMQPPWYLGPHPFTTAAFVSSIDHFSTSAVGTIASTPGGSGGSGFGGGGFSGGGGGGGGGGSW